MFDLVVVSLISLIFTRNFKEKGVLVFQLTKFLINHSFMFLE